MQTRREGAVNELKIGIAGLGYWGPNLLRNFRTARGCKVVAVADKRSDRLAEASRLYPDLSCHSSAESLIADSQVDAVVLALPAAFLPSLAIGALEQRKHVLVEKPMADSLSNALQMASMASRGDRVAMVDFTFLFSPPVQYLATIVREAALGRPHYYQSTRINLGRFQPDVDVIWDLVVHDVSILAYVMDEQPAHVMATGHRLGNGAIDTAHVTLVYDSGFQAFVHVSWMAPKKVRSALLACSEGMVSYDDAAPDEKIRLYKLEGDFDPAKENPLVPSYRLGDVTIPRLPTQEPLKVMAEAFVDAALGSSQPITTWDFGVSVLAVLDAAKRSIATGQLTAVSSPARH